LLYARVMLVPKIFTAILAAMSGAKACDIVQATFSNPILTLQLALAIAYALWAFLKSGNPFAAAWLVAAAVSFNVWASFLQPSLAEGLLLYAILSMILILEIFSRHK
jgi:hypothetical protein